MSFDRSKIKPVPIQKTIVLLNNFIANTTSFFNSFSETVEKKISNVSNKITELETLLAVLEAKLNSVPDLEGEAPGSTQPASVPVAASIQEAHVPIEIQNDLVVSPEAALTSEDPSKVLVSEHPDYLPFFRLIKVGVPSFVVQAKVTAAGLDPSMIDNPNRLVSL